MMGNPRFGGYDWNDMSEMTREQFVQHVIASVNSRFPLVKIARAEQSFSVKVNGHVASLENVYRIAVLNPPEMKHHIERWMVELLRAAEGRPDQGGSYEELKPRILPMILSRPVGDVQGPAMVTQPYLGGLMIAYAVDNDRTIAYIPQGHFENWKMSIDELHETALANLVARSESMAAHAAQDEDGGVNLILFQTMDGYDASRILLPTLHDRLREYLGSPFAAAIPNRDILLCFRNNDQTVTRLRAQIEQDYRQMPHQVTDELLLITPDGVAMRD
jgi:uncharacterized protein YtpQ (UPF0354 family)